MNQSLRNRIVQLLMPYQPVRIGVFGSFARKENIPIIKPFRKPLKMAIINKTKQTTSTNILLFS